MYDFLKYVHVWIPDFWSISESCNRENSLIGAANWNVTQFEVAGEGECFFSNKLTLHCTLTCTV